MNRKNRPGSLLYLICRGHEFSLHLVDSRDSRKLIDLFEMLSKSQVRHLTPAAPRRPSRACFRDTDAAFHCRRERRVAICWRSLGGWRNSAGQTTPRTRTTRPPQSYRASQQSSPVVICNVSSVPDASHSHGLMLSICLRLSFPLPSSAAVAFYHLTLNYQLAPASTDGQVCFDADLDGLTQHS